MTIDVYISLLQPHEVNSKVLTKKYLQEIEDQYKNKYLPEASKASEVLIYDWSNYGDIEDVVEDIERLEMDDWDPHLEKFEDWNLWEQELWEKNRIFYSNKKHDICATKSDVNIYEVDSMRLDPDDAIHRDKVYLNMVCPTLFHHSHRSHSLIFALCLIGPQL